MIAAVIGTVGFLREAVPFGGKHTLTADGLEAPAHAADSGKKINESEAALVCAGFRGACNGFQALDGGLSRGGFPMLPAVDGPECVTGLVSGFLEGESGFLPEPGEFGHVACPFCYIWEEFCHSVT